MVIEWMESGYSIRKREEKVDFRLLNRVIEWVVGSLEEGNRRGSRKGVK